MKKIIPTPHDRFFRKSLSDPRVAKEFFESYLPLAIREVIDLTRLTPCKESYIDRHLKLGVADMLFETYFKNHPGFIYLLNEHASTPQKMMALRLLKYTIPIMEEKSKMTEGGYSPLFIPWCFIRVQAPILIPPIFLTSLKIRN